MQDYYAQENELLNEQLATTLEACLDVPRIGAMIETFAKSLRFTRFRPARHADELQAAMEAMSDFLEEGDVDSCEQSIRSSHVQGEEMAELIHDVRQADFFDALVRATAAVVTERYPAADETGVSDMTASRVLDLSIDAVYRTDQSMPLDVLNNVTMTFCAIPGLDEARTETDLATSHWAQDSGCRTIKPDRVFARFLQLAGVSSQTWIATVQEMTGVKVDADPEAGAPHWHSERAAMWRDFVDLPPICDGPIADVYRIVEAVETAGRGFTPCIAFRADAGRMIRRDWSRSMTVSGGLLGLHDFINGTGDPIRFERKVTLSLDRGCFEVAETMKNPITEAHGFGEEWFRSRIADSDHFYDTSAAASFAA
jgi:hypothetical protein